MINRNNYEEYMLLYLDGELPSADRLAVENFLEANPDLIPELELLRQTLLQPETGIVFEDKSRLYRLNSGISLQNYQSFFLLYIDGELNDEDSRAVETFVLQNPGVQDEFTLLKETVLPKEEVIFKHKSSLYRKEEKSRPVIISIRWASLAAAVVLGLVALLIFTTGDQPDAVADKSTGKPAVPPAETISPSRLLPVNTHPGAEMAKAEKDTEAGIIIRKEEQKQLALEPVNKPLPVFPVESGPEPKQIAVVESTPVITEPVLTRDQSTVTTQVAETGFKQADEPGEASYVQPAVYTGELDTENDNSLYVGALQINPDKARGLFRKVGRFLSSKVKNTEEDEGKLQIANIEVNKIK